jgi:hypothetical protein
MLGNLLEKSAVDIIDWNPEEESTLEIFLLGKGQGGTLTDKKFKHLCYMFKSFYAAY